MNKSNKSRKEVDFNQFVMYPENPITKEGVFEYLGESLDREGELGLIPDKMYNVYRPASSLKDPNFLKSLELYPIFLDHHFVSGVPKSGFESPDDVVPRGAIGQKIYFDEDSGELRADIKVFSPLLKKTIEAGKKDIKKLKSFLNKHISWMPRTTLRYAIERFPEKERQKYLKK